MSKVKLTCVIATLILNISVVAADQADIQFKSGSVLIRCMAPNGHPVITTKLFNAAFPHWITAVQSMANKGVISRAHYLGELKQGIFIVVEGATREEALVNASVVVSEINAVTVNAIEATAEAPDFAVDDACQFIEIGPVAVTPMK